MNGIINILKPPGMTSSNAVVDVRRLTGIKKVGHLGTLDPCAAGVLPICVGKATRLSDYLMEKDKRYRCEIAFGKRTDTLDAAGTLLEQRESHVEESAFISALLSMKGEHMQQPPMYSAIKQDGKKLYELARSGQSIDLAHKRRIINIYEISYVAKTGDFSFLFDVHCSKGTYIRVLCEEIAEKLGEIAYMPFLLRTQAGKFDINETYSIAELNDLKEEGRLEEALTSMDDALLFMDQIEVDETCFSRLMNGNPIIKKYLNAEKEGMLKVYCMGVFIGIGYMRGDELVMRTMLCEKG